MVLNLGLNVESKPSQAMISEADPFEKQITCAGEEIMLAMSGREMRGLV